MNTLSPKTGTAWLFKMAWRDGKANISRLILFMASIILGIAAVVSIQSFSENLKKNIGQQSKALMGADFIIDSRNSPNTRVQQIIDSLGGANASEVNFVSMAAFPKTNDAKLVRVRGMKGAFPLYGTLETVPAKAALDYQDKNAALVDATLMLQYNLSPGDSITIGRITVPILAALKSIPGSSSISASIAPPVIIPFSLIEKTELLQQGSRKDYQYFFVASDKINLDVLSRDLNPILETENAGLSTHKAASARLGRRYTNVSKFLNLVAFIALLLGCIGIASSVHIYIKEKLPAVAVLKCMGATARQTFSIYLIQIAGMGFLGGLLGVGIGLGLQQFFPLLLQAFLPFSIDISVSVSAIVLGLVLGILMSVLFALLPLLSTWYVSPLEVLRVQAGSYVKSKRVKLLIFAAILGFIYAVTFWLLRDGVYALGFVLGVGFTFCVLAGIAVLFMKGIKHFFPKAWGFTARQSLLNLFRPNNQTLVLIIAIGLGAFLISTLYFTRNMLQSRATLNAATKDPNMILMDVQTTQKEAVKQRIVLNKFPVVDDLAIVTMRLHSIKEVLVNTIRKDSSSLVRDWVLNHEFRATYRDSLIPSEKIIEGRWVPKIELGKPVEISISSNFAKDTNLAVGDELVFNVQGVLMTTLVGSIRDVNWGRAQMNFLVVFPKGVLEEAPQFHVLTSYTPNEEASAGLQRDLVKQFPNVSVIDLRQILQVVEGVLNKISWVINFMAFFSILTGLIVLISSVRNSKYQRIKESVLLRTLGAKNKQILHITALEYFYLGSIGAGIGVLLSVVGSKLLASFVFEVSFVPSLIPFLIVFPAITILVLFIGLINSSAVLKSTPLEVLRREG